MMIRKKHTIEIVELVQDEHISLLAINDESLKDFTEKLGHAVFILSSQGQCIWNLSELYIRMNHEYISLETLFEKNELAQEIAKKGNEENKKEILNTTTSKDKLH
jgi:hypothetical protein